MRYFLWFLSPDGTWKHDYEVATKRIGETLIRKKFPVAHLEECQRDDIPAEIPADTGWTAWADTQAHDSSLPAVALIAVTLC